MPNPKNVSGTLGGGDGKERRRTLEEVDPLGLWIRALVFSGIVDSSIA